MTETEKSQIGQKDCQQLCPDGGTESPDDKRFVQTPSIKPTLIKFGLVLIGTVVIILYSMNRQSNNAVWIATVLGSLVAIRYCWSILLLQRTRYVVTPESIIRRYQLLGRFYSRRLPIEELRGTQITRTRTQSLLDIGTIKFLTGGMNQSLGFVQFSSVPDPEKIQDLIEKIQ